MQSPTLQQITDMSRADLCALWTLWFKTPPPRQINRPRLIQILAFETQARLSKGLDRKTQTAIKRLQSHLLEQNTKPRPSTPRLKTGARLIREWNGNTHIVDVTEHGFVWQGNSYASLSAIARAITGAHWSGPRFFGLTTPSVQKGKPNA